MRVQQIVEDPLMRHSAILVFANKQDLVSVRHIYGQLCVATSTESQRQYQPRVHGGHYCLHYQRGPAVKF